MTYCSQAPRTSYGLFASALSRDNHFWVFCRNLKIKRDIFILSNFAISATELKKKKKNLSASSMNYKCTLAMLILELFQSPSQTEQVTRCQSFFRVQFLESDCPSSNLTSWNWASHLIPSCLSFLPFTEPPSPSLELVWWGFCGKCIQTTLQQWLAQWMCLVHDISMKKNHY